MPEPIKQVCATCRYVGERKSFEDTRKMVMTCEFVPPQSVIGLGIDLSIPYADSHHQLTMKWRNDEVPPDHTCSLWRKKRPTPET